MILLVIGSRTFGDYDRLEQEILKRWSTQPDTDETLEVNFAMTIDRIYTGGKRVTRETITEGTLPFEKIYSFRSEVVPQDGACTQAAKFAAKYKIPITLFPPNWQQLPKDRWKANRDPAFLQFPGNHIIFWDGRSPGTRGEIRELKRLGKFNKDNLIPFNK